MKKNHQITIGLMLLLVGCTEPVTDSVHSNIGQDNLTNTLKVITHEDANFNYQLVSKQEVGILTTDGGHYSVQFKSVDSVYPHLISINVKSDATIKKYQEICNMPDNPYGCFARNDPDNFEKFQQAFLREDPIFHNGEADLELKKFNNHIYYVWNVPVIGESGFHRSYNTFVNDRLIEILIYKNFASDTHQNSDADVDAYFESLDLQISSI